MARSLNQITVCGHVGQDPEVNQTNAGKTVANVSIATSPPWDDNKTEWHRTVFWGKSAEIVRDYVKKGNRLLVTGRLEYNKWQDKNGNNRVTAQINVDDFVLLGSKGGGNPKQKSPAVDPSQVGSGNEELPF